MANNHDSTQNDSIFGGQNRTGQTSASRWPDFYALLQIAPQSDAERLRTRIREAYMEATANSDHRNIARRIHFQTMVERIVPQARRILLDPTLRTEYDRQLQFHRDGDPNAREYGDFLREVPGSGAFGSDPTSAVAIPGRSSENTRAQSDLDDATAQAALFGSADASPQSATFWSDLAIRDDETPLATPRLATPRVATHQDAQNNDAQSTVENEAIPVVTPVATSIAAPTPPNVGFSTEAIPIEEIPVEAIPVVESTSPAFAATTTPAKVPQPIVPEARPVPSPVAAPVTQTPMTTSSEAPTSEASPSEAPTIATPIPARETEVVSISPAREEGEVRARTLPAAEVAALAHTEVMLTPDTMRSGRTREPGAAPRNPRSGERASAGSFMSRTVQMLVTAIVAAGLTIFILRSNQAPTKIPLRIVYAPALESVMQAERARFAASPAGTAVELLMQPLDGRAAMQAALAPGFAADVWIPSETLWSDRYSDVASQKGARALQQSRSLALSPSVLVARADRAGILRQRFPNHVIPSWEALRGAINAGAAGHFGLGDPVKSGSGAVARYFMAREWFGKQGRELTPTTARDSGLWRWLASFEDNVPVAARMSSDMVKDLALGTGDRYWWAVAPESEAINWIKEGKNLEIWYLPQTNYADHPFASWDRSSNASGGAARAAFEALLRSDEGQKTLLQHGLRPTGIELAASVPNNPFTDQKLRARGLKRDGFRVIEKIPYRTLNALAAAWNERFS